MKLQAMNGQISFVGKFNEQEKIIKALKAMAYALDEEEIFWEDICQDSDYCEINMRVSTGYTIAQLKEEWRFIKKQTTN